MIDRKITKALEKLTVYELNSFRKFLLSPYFNQNEAFVVFFDMLNEAKRTGKDPGQIESKDVDRVEKISRDITTETYLIFLAR